MSLVPDKDLIMIKISQLTYGYHKDRPVLRDFSANYGPGIHLLMGYSGCGKTTLLKLIGGLLTPLSGRIDLAGQSVGGNRFLREYVGYVFQDLNLLPDASLKRNMEICAALKSSDSKFFDSRMKGLA
jgi:ABC-type multidrug transport system ATPase subunit